MLFPYIIIVFYPSVPLIMKFLSPGMSCFLLSILKILDRRKILTECLSSLLGGKKKGFTSGSAVKNLPAMQKLPETHVQSLGQENLQEKCMATHSNIPAWRIPWTEEPGGLQSMGSQRVGHN